MIMCTISNVLFFNFCFNIYILTLDLHLISFPVLTEDDHLKIYQHLKCMEDSDIILLGQALGLLRSKLKRLKRVPDEMIDAWLRQEDNVLKKSGPPTWENLHIALKEIDQNGIANEIKVCLSVICHISILWWQHAKLHLQ